MSELHTKYRPSDWREVVGQDSVIESVLGAIEEKRSRAYLFTGPSGTGKTTIARLIAKEVGAKGSNLLEIDAATHTGVDSMRDVQDLLRFSPLGGGSKVVIVDEAHQLSKSAWNSLLKSIEEPPPGVYWCFCTTEPMKVPVTIKTRCLVYDLKPVKINDLAELLERVAGDEGMDVVQEVLYLCAEKADGSPRKAITLMSSVADCESRQEAAILLREPVEDAEVVDFCRLLLQGGDWKQFMKTLAKMGETNPESVRRIVCAYFTKVIMDAKRERDVERGLAVLEAFGDPYPAGDQIYPLLLSIGALVYGE